MFVSGESDCIATDDLLVFDDRLAGLAFKSALLRTALVWL